VERATLWSRMGHWLRSARPGEPDRFPTIGDPLGPIGGGGMAMCIQYSDELLAQQQYAFDGTLTSIDGDTVTFEVHHWYKGGEGDSLTLDATGLTGGPNTAIEGTPLVEGQRYLATGSDGFLWACGYTVTFDSDLADHWAVLFGA